MFQGICVLSGGALSLLSTWIKIHHLNSVQVRFKGERRLKTFFEKVTTTGCFTANWEQPKTYRTRPLTVNYGTSKSKRILFEDADVFDNTPCKRKH